MAKSTLQETFGLTAQEVDFYQEHGWVMTSKVVEDAEIEETLAGLEEHWSGHRDRTLPGARKQFADWMPGDSAATRNNEYISLQNRKVSRLAWSPMVGAIAAAAAGTPEIRLFDDQIVYKPGGQINAVVGWHIDADYWRTCTSQDMLTAWIPLSDCPAEMGPLVVLDGSHRWSHLIDSSMLSFNSKDMESLQRYVEEQGFEFKPITMEMKRGQFSLHNCRAIHGSFPNRSDRPRIALAVHLQDYRNAYRAAAKPDGRAVQLYNDVICRTTAEGVPDYSDPSVFPVLWRAADLEGGEKGTMC